MFIGFYSIANTVTLAGLLSSVFACMLAANGNFKMAVYMMFLACLCDSFDGRIAKMKQRKSVEKFYGVQLDSLCDVISFGFTPCFIAFTFGFNGWLDVIIYSVFILCGAIRLAYFNTLAYYPLKSTRSNAQPGFKGVPIPMSTILITVLFLLTTFIPATVTVWLFRIGFLLLGIGFILKIDIKKPKTKKLLIMLAVQVVLLLILAIAGDCKAPQNYTNTNSNETVEVGK